MANWKKIAMNWGDSNGFERLDYPDDPMELDDARALFGDPDPNAYLEEERGYDGMDWFFKNDEGVVFKLYARWGVLRIGGLDCDRASLPDFKAWLKAEKARPAGSYDVGLV